MPEITPVLEPGEVAVYQAPRSAAVHRMMQSLGKFQGTIKQGKDKVTSDNLRITKPVDFRGHNALHMGLPTYQSTAAIEADTPIGGIARLFNSPYYGGSHQLVWHDEAGSTLTIADHSLWAAKGDIITATAAETPVVLLVGVNDSIIMADSAVANGIKWVGSGTAFDTLAPTTTKGDIIVHDGTNNVREAVGTNGYFILADSAQTSGIKWTDTFDEGIKIAAGKDILALGQMDILPAAAVGDGHDLTIAAGEGGATADGGDLLLLGGASLAGGGVYIRGGAGSFVDGEVHIGNADTSLVNIGAAAAAVTINGPLSVDNSAVFNESGADKDFRIEGDTNQNLFFVDASTDRVGIGTATPAATLDILGELLVTSSTDPKVKFTDGGTTPALDAGTSLVVQNNSAVGDRCRLSIIAGTSAFSILNLGDTDDENVGSLQYSHAANSLQVIVNAAARMTFLSDGKVGVAEAAPDSTLEVGGTFHATGASTFDADVLFSGDGSGVLFGEIYVKDNANATTLNSAAKVQVTDFAVDGESNGMTPDHTNDHITVDTAGRYLCVISCTMENVAAQAHVVELLVYKNNGATAFDNLHAHRQMSGGGGDEGSASLSGIIDLAATDTVELWADTDAAANRDVIFEDVTLSLVAVGGT